MPDLTSSERVQTALSHREPDRVPLLLSLTLHGAKEVGLPIRSYYSDARNVVEGQLRLRKKYGHDALLGFLYGAAEYEAWGGEARFVEDGPPTSEAPLFEDPNQLAGIEPPDPVRSPQLQRTLEVLRQLKAHAGDDVPVLGVVISPFSFPVMQLGFPAYLDLLYESRDAFWHLMALNQAFTIAWGKAQLAAGATALAYFDPLASPTLIPPELYRETGFQVARATLAALPGPTVTHLASGRCLGVLDLLAQTGTLGVGVSCMEDLGEVKARCRNRLAVVGNLDGISMVGWTCEQATRNVREAIAKASPGGGFVLSDNHGEIPWHVPDEVILAMAEAARTFGRYPLESAAAHD